MVLYLKYDTRFKCDILLEYNNNSMGDTFEAELTKCARKQFTFISNLLQHNFSSVKEVQPAYW